MRIARVRERQWGQTAMGAAGHRLRNGVPMGDGRCGPRTMLEQTCGRLGATLDSSDGQQHQPGRLARGWCADRLASDSDFRRGSRTPRQCAVGPLRRHYDRREVEAVDSWKLLGRVACIPAFDWSRLASCVLPSLSSVRSQHLNLSVPSRRAGIIVRDLSGSGVITNDEVKRMRLTPLNQTKV